MFSLNNKRFSWTLKIRYLQSLDWIYTLTLYVLLELQRIFRLRSWSELFEFLQQPCEWKCKHTKCTRKCGDICNRQPCDKPCDVKLPCGHDCIGFCGEPCPPQCRLCSPEIANVIFGYEKAPDARFVFSFRSTYFY